MCSQIQILNKKVDVSKVTSKCDSKANMKHKPGMSSFSTSAASLDEVLSTCVRCVCVVIDRWRRCEDREP